LWKIRLVIRNLVRHVIYARSGISSYDTSEIVRSYMVTHST